MLDDSSSDSSFVEKEVLLKDVRFDDMVHVLAKGEFATLGTDNSSAKKDERPEMRVNFTYDFSIGRHEVLCSGFNDVMKKVSGLKVPCLQDSLPASSMTFFDAVLSAIWPEICWSG